MSPPVQFPMSPDSLSASLDLVPDEPLTNEIRSRLDQLLAPGTADLRSVMQAAQQKVWDALVAGVALEGNLQPPDGLRAMFFGDAAAHPGWAVTFSAVVRTAIRETPQAEAEFIVGSLAALRLLASAAGSRLAALEAEQAAHGVALGDLGRGLREGVSLNREQVQVIADAIAYRQDAALTATLMARIEALSLDLGRVREIADAFLERIGQTRVPPDQLGAAFRGVAEKFIALREMQGERGAVSEGEISRAVLDLQEVVVLLRGGSTSGERIFCFVRLTLASLRRLHSAVTSGENFVPMHFGEVLAAGYGEPADELVAQMRRRLGVLEELAAEGPVLRLERRPPPAPGPQFDPLGFIRRRDDGTLDCENPMPDGGLAALTVNPRMDEEMRERFRTTITQMVLDETMNPKFAKVLLAAASLR
jgi:hypothetical protein